MRMQQVHSSNILSVGYEPENRLLAVEFNGGRIYEYYGVPDTVHRGLMQANSKGSFFHQAIKGQYSFHRLR